MTGAAPTAQELSLLQESMRFFLSHQWIVYLFALYGLFDILMKASEVLFREFVAWTHRMRLYWRRLRSEPDPHVL